MNDEMEKITSSKLPIDAYKESSLDSIPNEISLDSIPETDNLKKTEKRRRQKLKEEEESLKAEIARTARQAEDMEAVLRAAANKVKADEMQQGRKIDPEERDAVIMREALEFIANACTSRKDQDRINEDRRELDSHIRGSRR